MNEQNEPASGVDGELQAHIGRKLKAAYDDILGQPVPDRFLELLKALEEREQGDVDGAQSSAGKAP